MDDCNQVLITFLESHEIFLEAYIKSQQAILDAILDLERRIDALEGK